MLVAQNLVDNYSFEILTNCPSNYGGQGPTIAPPWWAPTHGTPDIFNDCATSSLVDVPDNLWGTQEPTMIPCSKKRVKVAQLAWAGVLVFMMVPVAIRA